MQDYIMSNAIDFTAMCYKNSCTGKVEITTDVAKNNHVRCLERADSPEAGLLGSQRKSQAQRIIPRGKSPPQPLAAAESHKYISFQTLQPYQR